ncbi:hypothetical protein DFH06DRAFT_1120633 [Mycena polygramma]|nr:hypothetical protein DFH06DRAFT_1120633 [Mycena polygramma]
MSESTTPVQPQLGPRTFVVRGSELLPTAIVPFNTPVEALSVHAALAEMTHNTMFSLPFAWAVYARKRNLAQTRDVLSRMEDAAGAVLEQDVNDKKRRRRRKRCRKVPVTQDV